ncbi:CD225/dispanin family protein [uncultured Porphyromonas sp.]|uniref:CD225/dispanin family protein n=1 Tax=uncultured Porphyromonas sp. TaxID=159274 RepID=UPI002627E759|nr:CD225/dispanin family protein [uncultured Porphyromonas sp.]
MKQYYIIRNEQQAGPYTLDELAAMGITPDTIVWTEDMTDWAPAREVSELNSLFTRSAQTPPSYSAPSYGAPQYHSAPQYNRPPQYSTPAERPPMPQTYLAWSIAVTILCCLVGGIVAIVYSSQVSSRYIAGDYEGAEYASRQARIWIIVSACVGLLVGIVYAIWMLFFATSMAAVSGGMSGI